MSVSYQGKLKCIIFKIFLVLSCDRANSIEGFFWFSEIVQDFAKPEFQIGSWFGFVYCACFV